VMHESFRITEKGELQKYLGKASQVIIPDGVKAIGAMAFYQCADLQEVRLPHGITRIGAGAFCDCLWLETINFPGSICEIGAGAFKNCVSLECAELNDGLLMIGARAFMGCTLLKRVIVPEGVTDIARLAFASCTSLAHVILPTSLIQIGEDAFKGTPAVLHDKAMRVSRDPVDKDGISSTGKYKNTEVICSKPKQDSNLAAIELSALLVKLANLPGAESMRMDDYFREFSFSNFCQQCVDAGIENFRGFENFAHVARVVGYCSISKRGLNSIIDRVKQILQQRTDHAIMTEKGEAQLKPEVQIQPLVVKETGYSDTFVAKMTEILKNAALGVMSLRRALEQNNFSVREQSFLGKLEKASSVLGADFCLQLLNDSKTADALYNFMGRLVRVTTVGVSPALTGKTRHLLPTIIASLPSTTTEVLVRDIIDPVKYKALLEYFALKEINCVADLGRANLTDFIQWWYFLPPQQRAIYCAQGALIPQWDDSANGAFLAELLDSAEGETLCLQLIAAQRKETPLSQFVYLLAMEAGGATEIEARKDTSFFAKVSAMPAAANAKVPEVLSEPRFIPFLDYCLKQKISTVAELKGVDLEAYSMWWQLLSPLLRDGYLASGAFEMSMDGSAISDFAKKIDETCHLQLVDRQLCLESYALIKANPRFDALVLRARGQTLEEVGNEYGVTRERVRQIESKLLRKLNLWLLQYKIFFKKVLAKNAKVIKVTDMFARLFDNADDIALIEYLFKVQEDLEEFAYLPETDLLIIDSGITASKITRRLGIIIEDKIGDVCDIAAQGEAIAGYLEDADLACLAGEPFRAFLLTKGYRSSSDNPDILRLSASKGNKYQEILERHFPEGMNIYDEAEMLRFRSLYLQTFADDKLPPNNRAINARISDQGVLCGKGRYIAAANVRISSSLMGQIKDYIMGQAEDHLLISDIFQEFREQLAACGVDNWYYLNGLLNYYYGDIFCTKKLTLSKVGRIQTNPISMVAEYLLAQGAPISLAQIYDQFSSLDRQYLVVALESYSNHIIKIGANEYIHTALLVRDEALISGCRHVIQEALAKGRGYANGRQLCEELLPQTGELDEALASLLTAPRNMFCYLKHYLDTVFNFNWPLIADSAISVQDITAEAVTRACFLADRPSFTIDAYRDFFENFFGTSTYGNVFEKIRGEYVQVNDEKLMLRSLFVADPVFSQQLDEAIARAISTAAYLPVARVAGDAGVPSAPLGLGWTPHLLQECVALFSQRHRLICYPQKNYRSMHDVIVKVDSPLQEYWQVVATALGSLAPGQSFAAEYKLDSWLQRQGLNLSRALLEELSARQIVQVDKDGRITVVSALSMEALAAAGKGHASSNTADLPSGVEPCQREVKMLQEMLGEYYAYARYDTIDAWKNTFICELFSLFEMQLERIDDAWHKLLSRVGSPVAVVRVSLDSVSEDDPGAFFRQVVQAGHHSLARVIIFCCRQQMTVHVFDRSGTHQATHAFNFAALGVDNQPAPASRIVEEDHSCFQQFFRLMGSLAVHGVLG